MSGNVLPRAFLDAPLCNGVGKHIGQLQRVTIKFCKSRFDSSGVRDFIEKYMLDFTRANPGTVVYLKPRRHRCPLIVAEYLNGNIQYVQTKQMSAEEVHSWLELLRTRSGYDIMPIYKRWRTWTPSAQGVWHPGLLQSPLVCPLAAAKSGTLAERVAELGACVPDEPTASEVLQHLYEKQRHRLTEQ